MVELPLKPSQDSGSPKSSLELALAVADVRVLLMVLFQTTGDEKWLSYRPKRDVALIADEGAGLSCDQQAEIRAAALEILPKAEEEPPAIRDPGNALMKRMMDTCLGEDVPLEYAPLMREELGFVSRDVQWRTAPAQTGQPVVIVGAGVSGIALGARLQRLGLPFIIVERHHEVGGVWLENRYPGAGVDTPNHAYSYSFGPRYRWSRFFSTRDEIQEYLSGCADEFAVRSHIRFNSVVEAARWDEGAKQWRVSVRGPDGAYEIQAAALISAIGQFGMPSIPAIEGADSFQGPAFHSAAWPEGLDITGKKVAIIGTGASAMQIVPTVVDDVDQITVYQRTAQWVRPIDRYRDSIGPMQWLLDHVPLYAAWFRFTMWWRYGDGLLPLLRKDPEWPHPKRSLNYRNDRHRVEMLAHIRKELGARTDLISQCTPSYPPFGKRILLDNGWYKAIAKPQAELVTQAVAAITPRGVRTADGSERPADIIVYATGFHMLSMASRLNIEGRGGATLAKAWADDNPRAYLGITVPGFPNFFIMGGPNTGLGHGGSAIFQAESQARYISGLLVRMIESGVAAVDVKTELFEQFVEQVDREHETLVWTHPDVSTYYRNKFGRVVTVMPFRLVDYWNMTHEPTLSDYFVDSASS